MRLLIFILFSSIVATSFSQQDSLKQKKWAIGIYISPDYCYRISYKNQVNDGNSSFSEKSKIGFSGGISSQYTFTKRLGIELSILYSTKGEKLHINGSSWETPSTTPYDPAIPNSGQSNTVVTPERTIIYSYRYLEIPLKLNCFIINKKLKLGPCIGFSTNIFIGKRTTSIYQGLGELNQIENSNQYNSDNIPVIDIAAYGGIGLSYDLSKKLFIKLEPNFRCFIRPLVDNPVSGYLYSIGCFTGLSYRF